MEEALLTQTQAPSDVGQQARVPPRRHASAEVVVARELTKVYEEVIVGTPAEVSRRLQETGAVRGEFVVIVEPVKPDR